MANQENILSPDKELEHERPGLDGDDVQERVGKLADESQARVGGLVDQFKEMVGSMTAQELDRLKRDFNRQVGDIREITVSEVHRYMKERSGEVTVNAESKEGESGVANVNHEEAVFLTPEQTKAAREAKGTSDKMIWEKEILAPNGNRDAHLFTAEEQEQIRLGIRNKHGDVEEDNRLVDALKGKLNRLAKVVKTPDGIVVPSEELNSLPPQYHPQIMHHIDLLRQDFKPR